MTQRIDRQSEGVFIIAATPFASDGALDLDSTDRMVDFYLDCGVSGMTILGIMGEAPKLSGEESARFAKHVLDRVAGRVPVVVGVSGAGLDNMARLSHSVVGAGAAPPGARGKAGHPGDRPDAGRRRHSAWRDPRGLSIDTTPCLRHRKTGAISSRWQALLSGAVRRWPADPALHPSQSCPTRPVLSARAGTFHRFRDATRP